MAKRPAKKTSSSKGSKAPSQSSASSSLTAQQGLTATELCASLHVDVAELAKWLEQGLPSTGRGRRQRFDAAAVAAWLTERGLAKKPRIVARQKDVGEHFAVSARTVQNWQGKGM